MGRSIGRNLERKLWGDCAGFCQNPECHDYLLGNVQGDRINLAEVAHIIGYGKSGPRSLVKFEEYADVNGEQNLIMLCKKCHHTVDVLEEKFTAVQMRSWKVSHAKNILLGVPKFNDEQSLLRHVSELLDENEQLFTDYGPFSDAASSSTSPDHKKNWEKVCKTKILKNNQEIINVIVKSKGEFEYPWLIYKKMLGFKTHVDSFYDNCVFGKVDQYKQFPKEFNYFVKTALGVDMPPLEVQEKEEIEFRMATIDNYINEFLDSHQAIESMEKRNIYVFFVQLKDGRSLKIFVTNTYFVTTYTVEKILEIDAGIDVILCSNPYATIAVEAHRVCFKKEIALHTIGNFMGALNFKGDKFLTYITQNIKDERISRVSSQLQKIEAELSGLRIYLFGSYISSSVYDDIDILIVHKDDMRATEINRIKTLLKKTIFIDRSSPDKLDLEFVDEQSEEEVVFLSSEKVRVY